MMYSLIKIISSARHFIYACSITSDIWAKIQGDVHVMGYCHSPKLENLLYSVHVKYVSNILFDDR